jgi:Stress responsive A/B Barrel Domain
MFRQVVAIRWADGASTEAKQGYRDALDALRGIPELLALTWGDDARHFEGNFDFVAVMDFADFASARASTSSTRYTRPTSVTMRAGSSEIG